MPFEGGKVTEEWIGRWLERATGEGRVQREKCLGCNGTTGFGRWVNSWDFGLMDFGVLFNRGMDCS